MKLTRRSLGLMLLGVGGLLLAGPAMGRLFAQDSPNRREFTIVPAGGSTTFEFRADRAGTFPFYCNLTSEAGHQMMHGELVVRGR